ncbi:hypothetical protein OG272_03835 [Streptomyces sp. NBC_00104]
MVLSEHPDAGVHRTESCGMRRVTHDFEHGAASCRGGVVPGGCRVEHVRDRLSGANREEGVAFGGQFDHRDRLPSGGLAFRLLCPHKVGLSGGFGDRDGLAAQVEHLADLLRITLLHDDFHSGVEVVDEVQSLFPLRRVIHSVHDDVVLARLQ